MKLIINFYNNLKLKPSHKFYLNLFFFKNMFSFNLKQLQYIHIFTAIKKVWKIKIFKFNYSLYFYFIIVFLIINIILQLLIIIII
jgi:hypothetical protein